MFNKTKTNEPVTALCYQVTQKKEDLWLGVIGCISDKFFPDFYKDFSKEYPELSIKSNEPFEILYESEIGKIAKMLSFSLMDRTTNVIQMIRFLMKAKSPHDVLEESKKNSSIHKRYNEINKRYTKFLEKAGNEANPEKLLFFQYGGDLSISGILSNELSFKFPNKIIVVVYITGVKANVSARGGNIREIFLESIKDLEGASGGGHEEAVGAKIRVEDLEIFRKNLERLIGNSHNTSA